MNSSMDLQNMVKEALGILYHHPDVAVRTCADLWPQEFPRTIDAWQAQYLNNDPSYLNCKSKECKESEDGECLVHTCSGSISFHVVNIRTEIEFVFFTGGFGIPCIIKRTQPISFSNPSSPLHAHLSCI